MSVLKIVNKISEVVSDAANEILKHTEKVVRVTTKIAEFTEDSGYTMIKTGQSIAQKGGQYLWDAGEVAVKGAIILKDSVVSGIDIATDVLIPNKKMMKEEVDALKKAAKCYNEKVKSTKKKALELHKVRAGSGRELIQQVERYINTLANTPKVLEKAISDYLEFNY